MNLYEITLHDTESIYLLAPTKYRALELAGDYLADAGCASPKLYPRRETSTGNNVTPSAKLLIHCGIYFWRSTISVRSQNCMQS
jgi:hypothetical protein